MFVLRALLQLIIEFNIVQSLLNIISILSVFISVFPRHDNLMMLIFKVDISSRNLTCHICLFSQCVIRVHLATFIPFSLKPSAKYSALNRCEENEEIRKHGTCPQMFMSRIQTWIRKEKMSKNVKYEPFRSNYLFNFVVKFYFSWLKVSFIFWTKTWNYLSITSFLLKVLLKMFVKLVCKSQLFSCLYLVS